MKYEEFENCGLKRSLDILSGKWKPVILHYLFQQNKIRFIELWRLIPHVSKKVLIEQLKQLEESKIVERVEVNEFPQQVYYRIHKDSVNLGPILLALDKWGQNK